MHAASLGLMDAELLQRAECWEHAHVLDVGSLDVNGTYRELVERRGWRYTGLDVEAGPNVDIVPKAPYTWPIRNGAYDVVICGNMLHNTAHPWLLVPEMARVLRLGGLLVVVTITWNWAPAGRYPIDAWRFMRDGLKVLFDQAGCLERYAISTNEESPDIVASAFKMGYAA